MIKFHPMATLLFVQAGAGGLGELCENAEAATAQEADSGGGQPLP